MPKLIGRHPFTLQATIVNALPVCNTRNFNYAQCSKLRDLGYKGPIYAIYNTSDRGGPNSLAKRWYNWYISVNDLRVSLQKGEVSIDLLTKNMKEKLEI